METKRFCPAMWLSGFFGLGAAAHLVRSILGFSLAVGGREIPVGFSMVLAVLFGAASAALLIAALKRPCGTAHKGPAAEEKKGCCGLPH